MEQRIVALLQGQDRAAIDLLYDHYSPALFGVILRIVQSRELAEQVLQDVFVRIWRNGHLYDAHKSKLYTWMLNIARNAAIDATRTAYFKHFRKTDDLTLLTHVPASESINPDVMDVRKMVHGLEDKYRILIEKIYFEGYTQQEIEQELNIPLGTIKTRLRAAMSALRARFDTPNAAMQALLVYVGNWIIR